MFASVSNQVNKLKRNLLRLIGIGEFSDSAEWKDPCLSYVLPEVTIVSNVYYYGKSLAFIDKSQTFDSNLISLHGKMFQVICKQCNHCRDIDLCKDPFVSSDNSGVPTFVCSGADCRTPYDTADIEHLLLDAVQRKTMGYVLQDLSCLKCKQVKASNMAKVRISLSASSTFLS